jgi:hypothetical protein
MLTGEVSTNREKTYAYLSLLVYCPVAAGPHQPLLLSKLDISTILFSRYFSRGL